MTTVPGDFRLLPPPPGEWSDEVVDALETGRAALLSDELQAALDSRDRERLGAALPNAITVMLHNPGLAGGWLAYNGALLRHPALSPRQRELLILRVAWVTRSKYEWAQHVRMASRYGIDAAEVEALAADEVGGDWDELEAALIDSADQLLRHHTIADSTWALLRSNLDDRQLLEVPFVVGSYALLASAFNAFGLPLDPQYQAVQAPPFPESERD